MKTRSWVELSNNVISRIMWMRAWSHHALSANLNDSSGESNRDDRARTIKHHQGQTYIKPVYTQVTYIYIICICVYVLLSQLWDRSQDPMCDKQRFIFYNNMHKYNIILYRYIPTTCMYARVYYHIHIVKSVFVLLINK